MSRIILPLDGMEIHEAVFIVNAIKKVDPKMIWGFKVNDLLIEHGVNIIQDLTHKGFNVMADPKLYDIPNTMSNSLKRLITAGAKIITVHCSSLLVGPASGSNTNATVFVGY